MNAEHRVFETLDLCKDDFNAANEKQKGDLVYTLLNNNQYPKVKRQHVRKALKETQKIMDADERLNMIIRLIFNHIPNMECRWVSIFHQDFNPYGKIGFFRIREIRYNHER